MYCFVISFLIVGVLSLDDVRFKIGSDVLDYLRDGAIDGVLDQSGGNTPNIMYPWTDTEMQTTLESIGAESNATYSRQLQALTDAFRTDSAASGMYFDIERELESPETMARMLGGAVSLEDAENKQELLQINMEKELKRLDGPLRSFMQQVAQHAEHIGVLKSFALPSVRNYKPSDFFPGLGISWQISNVFTEGLFIEVQARLNRRTGGISNKIDFYDRYSLSTRIRIGYINEDLQTWFTWKHDETSRRGGVGVLVRNGVDCLQKSCVGEDTKKTFDAVGEDMKNAADEGLDASFDASVDAAGVVPGLSLADDTAEDMITASVRRRQKHHGKKMPKRLRGESVKQINTESTRTASSATKTTNTIAAKNTMTASPANKQRFRIFVHLKLRWAQGEAKNDISFGRYRRDERRVSFNVDVGLNFYDDFSTFRYHLEPRFIFEPRSIILDGKNLPIPRRMKGTHVDTQFSPFSTVEAGGSDGDTQITIQNRDVRVGGGIEVWGVATRSDPPKYNTFPLGWKDKFLLTPLKKIGVNLFGGYPSKYPNDETFTKMVNGIKWPPESIRAAEMMAETMDRKSEGFPGVLSE